MPPLSMLIKPVSGACGLRCRYCFYQEKHAGAMSLETLEALVKKALGFAGGSCTFMFQGGEPTLAGLPFFEKLVQYQKMYNTNRVSILNGLQTNGQHINGAWADFLAKNDFLAGLSLDGPRELHDKNRGKGSFDRAMQSARLFQQAGVQFNILCVVTKDTAKQGAQVYRFFRGKGFRYLQFIPCLDPIGMRRGGQPWSLTPQGYLAFLKATFDLWYRDMKNGDIVSVRWFDNLLAMVMGRPPEACGMSGACSCQFVTEADGSVYPCDFYVDDAWMLGRILEDSFEEMRFSPNCVRFIEESLAPHPGCKACRWFPLCRGGCKRDRLNDNRNYYCLAYRGFFAYAMPGLRELAVQFQE